MTTPPHHPARRNLLRVAAAGAVSAAGLATATPAWGRATAAPQAPPPGLSDPVQRGDLVVDVRDHGAVGDGVADDTAAIQAALDEGRGRTVYLPPGTYPVSTMLTVFGGTTVLATATTVVRRTDGPSIVGNGVLGDMTATGFDGESDIVIQGGVWDVNASNVALNGNGFSFSHGRNIRVYDVRVRDVQGWHAMELNAVETVRVVNCRFEGFSDPQGNRQYSEAVHMDYAGGPGHFTLFGAPDFYGCKDVEVSGCYAGPSADFPSYPRLVGSHGGPDGHQHAGLRVVGNYADGCTEWAVRLYDWLDGVVQGNQIVGGGGGIQIGPAGVQTGGNVVVSGNTLRGLAGVQEAAGRPPDAAICVGRLNNSRTHRLTVADNVVEGVAMEGISVYRTDGCVVSGNVVEDCEGAGIRLHDAPRAVVTSNAVARTGAEAVVVADASNAALVAQNRADDPTAAGVRVTGTVAEVVVRGNVVRGDAAYGIAIGAGATGTWHTGNDLRGGYTTGPVDDQGSGSLTDPAGVA